MKLDSVEVGMLVTSVCDIHIPNVPTNTLGIVSAVKCVDDVYVEFEMGQNMVSEPVLCHPIHLEEV